MGLVTLLLLFVVFSVVVVLVEMRIRAYRRQKTVAKEQNVLSLRLWVKTTTNMSPQLRQWVLNLSDEAIYVLVKRLNDFCTDLGLRLEWLFSQNAQDDRSVVPVINQIVANYLDACYQAYLVQDDANAFEKWRAYLEQPFAKEHHSLAERVLDHLIDEGISPPEASSLLETTDKERDVYIHYAVREASEKHPVAFHSVFKSVITSAHIAQSA
jgi:hypothetical protein